MSQKSDSESECNPDMPTENPAVATVQRQLDAYNAKDLDVLVSIYADDAQLFEHPATLLASGTAELRKRFAARFQEPNLHALLLNRCGLLALNTR